MPSKSNFYEKVNELLQAQTPFVAVTVVDTTGSVPNDAGTKMLVTREGLYYGTVGGGRIEKKAIDEAISLLLCDDPAKRTHFVNWSLEKDVGMTCGGMSKLFFEKHNCTSWQITIFGAGHVANALIGLLETLDCRITCIDPRKEWLDKLPESASLKKVQSESDGGADSVKDIPEGSFVLIMTMGHATDLPILRQILETRQFPYLGVIGSAAKAIRIKKDLASAGIPEAKIKSFYCPIGLPFGSNHPQEIAISIVAQLLQERDRIL